MNDQSLWKKWRKIASRITFACFLMAFGAWLFGRWLLFQYPDLVPNLRDSVQLLFLLGLGFQALCSWLDPDQPKQIVATSTTSPTPASFIVLFFGGVIALGLWPGTMLGQPEPTLAVVAGIMTLGLATMTYRFVKRHRDEIGEARFRKVGG